MTDIVDRLEGQIHNRIIGGLISEARDKIVALRSELSDAKKEITDLEDEIRMLRGLCDDSAF